MLWFTKSKFDDQELKWESPWGLGYPGWHIECSAISLKYLGEHLDIHCGGVDNAFPHHTNEIAQSEAYLGHKWCKYWFHVMHLVTNTGKMSKSSGEFLTVALLKSKGYDPLVYRFFCLQSHYRRSLMFSYEGLDNAKISYEKLLSRIASLGTEGDRNDPGAEALRARFREALDADLNTSLAVTALYDVLKADISDAAKRALIAEFDEVLSLGLIEGAAKLQSKENTNASDGLDPALASEIEEQIALRAKAKKEKNYAEADRIRAALAARGITLIDTPQGTKYNLD